MFTVYGREDCPYCANAKKFIQAFGWEYTYIDTPKGSDTFKSLKALILNDYNKEINTVPQIFVNDGRGAVEHIGGYSDLVEWTLRKDTV